VRSRIFWANRTACEVLEEIRTVVKVSSANGSAKAMLIALIEELQVMFNKMEAAIADKRDFNDIREETSKAKQKLRELEEKIKFLGGTSDEE
jgi:translation elongation factor EF-1alpha